MKTSQEYIKKINKEKVKKPKKSKHKHEFKDAKFSKVCKEYGSKLNKNHPDIIGGDIVKNLKKNVDADSNKVDFKKKKKMKTPKSEEDTNLKSGSHHPSIVTEDSIRVKRKKHKKVKQKKFPVNLENEVEENNCNLSESKPASTTSNVSTKCEYEQDTKWEEFVDESAKKRLHEIKTQPNKPGNLTDYLQIKKYGRLILPYDASLDPTFKIPEWDDPDLPKINKKWFDVCKRKNKDKRAKGSTVFVGNLPKHAKPSLLKRIFAKCGPILDAKVQKNDIVVKEETNKAVNGRVTFSTGEGLEAALELNGSLHDGRHLRVTRISEDQAKQTDCSVFIGNLSFGAQDDDLWKAFESCGDIDTVRIVRDMKTGRGKGFGFVNFKSPDAVPAALELDGTTVLDRELRVSRHSTKVDSLSNQEHVKRRHKKRWRAKQNKTDMSVVAEKELKRKSEGREEEDEPPKKSKKKKKKKSNPEEPLE